MRNVFSTALGMLILASLLGPIATAKGGAHSGDLRSWESMRLGDELWQARPIFKQCPEWSSDTNTFALCATATCWTLDSVAYCKCDVLNEQSISLPFPYRENGTEKDVCDLLLDGSGNGFTVSTYATPRQLEKDYRPKKERLGPPLAIYTCPVSDATAGYSAECDGGLCFTSTQGQEFPGFGQLEEDEIICSCPIVANGRNGFQMAGPWHCKPGNRNKNGRCCDERFQNKFCGVSSKAPTGTSMVVGASTGFGTILSTELDGQVPSLNQCFFPFIDQR